MSPLLWIRGDICIKTVSLLLRMHLLKLIKPNWSHNPPLLKPPPLSQNELSRCENGGNKNQKCEKWNCLDTRMGRGQEKTREQLLANNSSGNSQRREGTSHRQLELHPGGSRRLVPVEELKSPPSEMLPGAWHTQGHQLRLAAVTPSVTGHLLTPISHSHDFPIHNPRQTLHNFVQNSSLGWAFEMY